MAENYVKTQGLESVIDQEVHGLYPDLFAKDLSLIVECGTTSATKVRQYFTQLPQLKRLVILPYPFAEQTELYAFEFTKGNNFTLFIEDRANMLRQTVLRARSKK